MSTTIDSKVVEMRFDNKQFESNVSTTMSTLDKLKQSLRLDGAAKGLQDVDAAAKNCDVSGLGNAVETVRMRFSSLQVMAITAIANITNSAVNAGKKIVSALTIDPIKTGLQEYETQINAVQTILANTESKGSTLKDVNGALDELNTYADKTIYNFTEMTRNIGTFTAAGVDLDTSVSAIQGIANLAAVSGSNSQQASTAMYQLSQALSSGTVKLQDWNSVVNAGMGGQVFQDALKRTATVMGTNVDALIEKNGSFRESLQEGWITAEVLTTTLNQFTMAAEEGSEEWKKYKKSLMDDGYTAKQAEEILKMANTATDAATKVKTFSQLWDTLKETAQSGWTQTWEIILGDFEEAKELFSDLYNTFSPMIDAMSKSRNELLEGWAEAGGRTHLIDSLYNIIDGLSSIVKPIKEAFRDIFPPMTVEKLTGFTKGLVTLTEKLKLNETTSDKLKRTFKGVFALLDIGVQITKALFRVFGKILGVVAPAGDGFLGFTAKIGDFIVGIDEAIKSSDIFNKIIDKIGKFLKPVADGVKSFGKSICDTFKDIKDNAEVRFEPLTALGEFLKSVFVGLGKIVAKVFPFIAQAASGIGKVLGELMNKIASSIQNADYNQLFDILNSGIFATIGIFIAKFINSGKGLLDNAGGILESIKGLFDGLGESLNAFTGSIKAKTLQTIATAIAILAGSLLVLSLVDSEKVTSSLAAVAALFVELMAAMAVFGKLSEGKGVKGLFGMITISKAIMSLSKSLLVLAVAMKILSTMSWSEMGVALVSLTVGLAALVAAVHLLPERRVNKAARAIRKLSSALLVLSVSIKLLSTMSWNEMGVGLTAMVVGLGALVLAIRLLPTDTALRSAGLMSLAMAMVVLGAALKIMATMSWGEVARSLVTLSGSLLILSGAMALMKRAIPGAAAMLIIAPALVVLANAMTKMGAISWSEIARGLTVLAGSLFIIAGAMTLMKYALPGAASLLVVTASLRMLAPVLTRLGGLSWGEIAKGLTSLAGAFTVIGLAGLILRPVIPTILKLSAAFALFGIACVAIGAGVMMVGAGITALATALASAGGAIVVFVSGIIGLIPFLIEQAGIGLIKLCEVIAGSSAALFKAVSVIVVTLVDALVAAIPSLVEGLLVLVESLLTSLAKHTPAIVSALFDFLISLIEGIGARLPELIKAGVDLLMIFFQGVIDAMKDIDTGVLIEGIKAVGLLSGIVVALSLVAGAFPLALVGVIGLGLVIAELAIVLSAIGALAQLPGLKWLVGEGGNLLQLIGTAIGKFLGGIVGGFALGATATLPQIGKNLSDFMTNAKTFLEGVKGLDASVLKGVGTLTGVILALTAANLLESITSWVTGKSSITSFAEELPALGKGLMEFSDSVEGISVENITAASKAAKALGEMAANIPNEGGLAGFFAGENSIAAFSDQLPKLGKGLSGFSKSVEGINAENIKAAASAAKAIAEMADTIPNEGGVAAWFAGDNSIAMFGVQLLALGAGLSAFSIAVEDINAENIKSAASSAKALADMASVIPNEGGVASWFAGDNSIANFAGQLPKLGKGLMDFSTSVEGINVENVSAATSAAKTLADMASVIPNEGGVASWFAGDNSIATFSDQLPKLGKGLSGFSKSVEGINAENVTAAVNAAKTLAQMTSVIPNEGGVASWFAGENSIASFGDKLPVLGKGLKGFSTSVEGINAENVTAAANAAKTLAGMADTVPNEGGISAWFTGEKSVASFGDKLPALGKGLKGFSDSIEGINAENVKAASNAAKNLAQMAETVPSEGGMKAWFTGEKSVANFGGKLPTLGKGLKGFSDSVKGINPTNVTAASKAAKNLASMAETTPKNTDKIVDFGTNLVSFGGKLSSFFGKTKGISSESISTTSNAIKAVKDAANNLKGNTFQSASKGIDSLVKSIKGMAGVTEKTTSGFVSAMKKLGETNINALLKAFKSGEPKLTNAGKAAMDAFVKGINAKSNTVKSAVNKVASNSVSGTKTYYTSFYNAGGYLVKGFAAGISASTWRAEAKAKAMANAAEKAAKKALDINSPSKVFRAIGYSVPEGFAMGIDRMIGLVTGSSKDMATTAVNTVSSAIARVADVVNSDIETQPTIRPVMDLSAVSAGAGAINSMLGFTPSIGVLSNVRAINSMMNRNQNGTNKDVVSAIKDLEATIGKTSGDSYTINGVTYSEGSDVSDAVKTLVRAVTVGGRK